MVVQEQQDDVKGPSLPEILKRTGAYERWRGAAYAAIAPFAKLERIQPMLGRLRELFSTQRCSVRFSTHTGLVRTLRGDIYPMPAEDIADMDRVVESFLGEYGTALHGSETPYSWMLDERSRERGQDRAVASVRRIQVDRGGIPVYGATIVFGFDGDGRLSFVSHSWYPLDPDREYVQDFVLDDLELAQSVAIEYVRRYCLRGSEQKGVALDASPGFDWSDDGRVIYPLLNVDEATDLCGPIQERRDLGPQDEPYRAAWVILVSERGGPRSWEIIIDATDKEGLVLNAVEVTVRAPVDGDVYLANSRALSGMSENRELDGSVDSLSAAPHFAVTGADVGAAGTPPQLRAANVYFHLCRALDRFAEIANDVANVWPPRLEMPGEGGARVPVDLPHKEGTGEYNRKDRALWFGQGATASTNHPKVCDPALDCEVIYHEYAHAVLHNVQPDLFAEGMPGQFRKAITEGLAFYYGATLSVSIAQDLLGDLTETQDLAPLYRWGEFAYADQAWEGFRDLWREDDQQPGFDYLPVYNTFPTYLHPDSADPDGQYYACGMLWARALWDIVRLLGHRAADSIILRGMRLAGGIQGELETPAEAILHADSEYFPEGETHESALRLLFASRGIMADAPVHDVICVTVNGHTCLLAATEDTQREDAGCGCKISLDQGDSWVCLGQTGPGASMPAQVVALAAIEAEDGSRATVWAVGPVWLQGPGDPSPRPAPHVLRYELEIDPVTDEVNTSKQWQQEISPPADLEVFCLAAMKAPDSSGVPFWVFAGTDGGLYMYDGQGWSQRLTHVVQPPVFDLAIRDTPSRGLVVAAREGIYVYDPASDSIPLEREESGTNFLSVFAGQGHIWAGTAREGVYHFDPDAPGWAQDATLGRPAFKLLVEQHSASRDLYAGTDDGVYKSTGTAWLPQNASSSAVGESIERTAVIALCRIPGGARFAGTAQRGLWRQTLGQWTRLTQGLPRLGLLTDASAPVSPSGWSHVFSGHVTPGGIGTHVLYVPSPFTRLQIAKTGDVSRPWIGYVSPYTDPTQGHIAGLQHVDQQEIDASSVVVHDHPEGFYLLSVAARDQPASYTMQATFL